MNININDGNLLRVHVINVQLLHIHVRTCIKLCVYSHVCTFYYLYMYLYVHVNDFSVDMLKYTLWINT